MTNPWVSYMRKVTAAVLFAHRGDDAGDAGFEEIMAMLDPGLEREQFYAWFELASRLWDAVEAQRGAEEAERVFEAMLIELADDARFATTR